MLKIINLFESMSRWKWLVFVLAAALLIFVLWLSSLRPIGMAQDREFEVKRGEGLMQIASNLESSGIIRSAKSFAFFAALTGQATRLKSGWYVISSGSSTPQIIYQLGAGIRQEIQIIIPEGASVYLQDKILSENHVLKKGELVEYITRHHPELEGYLFPDTYLFFANSEVEQVAKKMKDNFDSKTAQLLPAGKVNTDIIIKTASLLEKEVPGYEDRRIVAGLLAKRMALGMPLQVDATICYAKQVLAGEYKDCHPFQPGDFKIDSPYNTYLYKGMVPGPIGNPGLSAIRAALNPKPSPYLFYLSDPKTGKTIFAKTLEEQSVNRAKYLN